jgi:predicted RNase H-like nuclease (RuvC/YqgF family)
MNRTQVSDFFQEEHMPLCSCDSQLKATFFCFVEPKCNGGQVYYCADCCEEHEHKSVVISKKIREVSKQWNELISEILQVERQATYRYNSYEELIRYCDEVNRQLPKAQQISEEGNLFADYTELSELKQWAQEQKSKVDTLVIKFKVVELLEME